MSSFTVFDMLRRLERNNFVQPIETIYHSKTNWDQLRYWPRDWKDFRVNGWGIKKPIKDRRLRVIGYDIYTLSVIAFTINQELELWLPLSAPNWADEWEVMDVKGGKPQPDGLGGMVPSSRGQIMYNFTARSMSRVYQTLVGPRFAEWVKS